MMCNLFIFFFITISITLCSACSNEKEKQFQFPIKTDDVEKIIADKGLDWPKENIEYNDDYETVFTLKNIEKITVGIDTVLNKNGKVINLVWSLHKDISQDKLDEFYHNELPKLFDLAATF